jgi:hypothetical protein
VIVSCDPPRHAVLIHFGPQLQTRPLSLQRARVGSVDVEYVIDEADTPPVLVAVHFPRHHYRLPFVHGKGTEVGDFNLEFGRREHLRYFFFSRRPMDWTAVEARPGLAVLIDPPPAVPGGGGIAPEHRPTLRGFVIDETLLSVAIDTTEVRVDFGVDNLKDIDATLFCTYP